MLSDKLKQIREKSDLVLSSNERTESPTIKRTWGQLEREIKLMNERIQPTQELHAKAHYFLASNGIDTEHISTPINTSQTFAQVDVENHTNIKEFLDEEHEKRLIHNIEDKRSQNIDDFEAFYDKQFEEIFENIERERREESENAVDYKEFEKYNNTAGVVRINDYASVITNLNNSRLHDVDFDIIQNLSNIRNMSELRKAQDCASETWDILKHFVDKSNIVGRSEGRFTKTYASESYQHDSAVNTRRALISASKSWLEQQSTQFINDALNRHAKTIKMGGIPSFNHRLRAFIDLTFKTSTGWIDDRLEIVNDLPIWAFVFYLMRCGHLDLAAKFVDGNREMFANDRKFVSYFEQYVNADYYCVSKPTQEAILADYYKLEYGEKVIDPYKLIVYKIIGRCELHKKSLPDVIRNTEDYIWLQLTLVREVINEEPYSFERYRLSDVQKHVASYGSTYFDPENTNPWIYFRILILTLQFEKSIEFLYKQKKYRLETVHFAVALVYHGLLRVIPPSKSDTKIMLITENEENEIYNLNFPTLLYQYIQIYIPENRQNALQYIYLLSLYSQANGYPDQTMVQLARMYVCKYIIDSKDFKTLLGSMDDTHTPGLIEKNKSLLYIESRENYAEQILYPTAEQCIQTGRCSDAVYIYSLAHDYNKMVDVLAKELSDALQQSQADRIIDCTLSDAPNVAIIQFATETMQHYEKFEPFTTVITPERQNTIRILIQLLQFRTLYEQNEYEKAFQQLEQVNVVPLRHDHYHIRLLVDQFNTLDDNIKKNIPEILLNAMDILYKTWASHTSQSSASRYESQELEKRANAVLTFAGLLQFNIPTDIIIRLNKASVLMMSARGF